MTDRTRSRILLAVLLLGLASALFLCLQRARMEAKNSRVCVVMTEAAAARIDGLPETVRLFDGDVFRDDAVLLVEDDRQYSYVPDERIGLLLDQFPAGAQGGVEYVRCFRLIEKYAARYAALGYSGAEEIENILYRAVTDRNVRVLWLEPFTDAVTGETVTDGAVYGAMLDSLRARLSRHGLTLGTDFSVLPAHEPALWALVLCAFGLAAALMLLLVEGFGLRKKTAVWLLPVLCLAAALLLGAEREASVRLFSFGAAVLFPCLAATLLIRRLARAQAASLGRSLGAVAASAALCWLIVLAGGLFVGAFQSGTRWLLAIDNFRGVKLSLLVPLVYAAYLILRRLSPLREIVSGKAFPVFVIVLAAAVVLIVFLLRSGDGILPVGQAEQRARNALERWLLVRPRTKEFLIGWPCLGIAWIVCLRAAKRRAWPFVLLAVTGFSSVVNSFCHSRCPLWVSTVRGALGLLIGLAVALVFTALFHRPAGSLGSGSATHPEQSS